MPVGVGPTPAVLAAEFATLACAPCWTAGSPPAPLVWSGACGPGSELGLSNVGVLVAPAVVVVLGIDEVDDGVDDGLVYDVVGGGVVDVLGVVGAAVEVFGVVALVLEELAELPVLAGADEPEVLDVLGA